MDLYKETFETWNKIASIYQEKFMHLDIYNDSYDFICNSITKAGAKILELGCGPGNITKYLSSVRPDFEISGIDMAPAMIELAKKNNPSAHFTVMDIRHIDEIKTKYDAIVCGFCLPFLSQADCQKLFNDSYHLLNEEGLIYISFMEGEPGKFDIKTTSTGDRTIFYYYSLDDLSQQLSKNNFDPLKTFTVDYKKNETDFETHQIIIAKKK